MALLDDLVSYWKLDEASGTRNDSHSTNHLTDVNTVTQAAAAKIGNAAQFTSANVERLTVTDNPALSVAGSSFTVTAWIWMDTQTAMMGIAARDDVAANREFGMYFQTPNLNLSIGAGASIATRTAPATGQWVFVVGWRDSVANTTNLQVDNGTVGTASNATEAGDTAAPFTIGCRGAGNIPFNGRIDEVGYWKRVLTAQERTDLYNGGAGLTYPFVLSGTLAATEGATDAAAFLGTRFFHSAPDPITGNRWDSITGTGWDPVTGTAWQPITGERE